MNIRTCLVGCFLLFALFMAVPRTTKRNLVVPTHDTLKPQPAPWIIERKGDHWLKISNGRSYFEGDLYPVLAHQRIRLDGVLMYFEPLDRLPAVEEGPHDEDLGLPGSAALKRQAKEAGIKPSELLKWTDRYVAEKDEVLRRGK